MAKKRSSVTRAQARKRRQKIKLIAGLTAALLFVILVGVAFSLRIDTIHYSGNTHYTDEQMTQLLYPGSFDRLYLYDRFKDRWGKEQEIPYIERIEKTYPNYHSVDIVVYEKSLTGCIHYMDSYMYFDKDGMIVESDTEKMPEIPVITGLTFQRIVLFQELPVKNRDIFVTILNLTQLIQLYHIPVESIHFNLYRQATLYLNDEAGKENGLKLSGVTVELGDSADLEEKMAELKNQITYLSGLEGTLHLETFDRNAANPRYIFTLAEVPEKETETTNEE